MQKKVLFLLSVLVLFISSCSLHIEKRRYQRGFFIQKRTLFSQKKIENNKNDNYAVHLDSITLKSSTNDPIFENTIQSGLDDNSTSIPLTDLNNLSESRENNLNNNKTERKILKKVHHKKVNYSYGPLKINPSPLTKKEDQPMDEENSGVLNFLIFFGAIILTLLALFVFFVFAISAGYGSPLWVVILLGLADLAIVALIILLLFQLDI